MRSTVLSGTLLSSGSDAVPPGLRAPLQHCQWPRFHAALQCLLPGVKACKAVPLRKLTHLVQDRLEQLGAEKRRQKQAEHRREVERLLQHKRDLYEAARVRRPPWAAAVFVCEVERLLQHKRVLYTAARVRAQAMRCGIRVKGLGSRSTTHKHTSDGASAALPAWPARLSMHPAWRSQLEGPSGAGS